VSLARTVTLAVVAALVLWRALRWIGRHVEMLQARAPKTGSRALPGMTRPGMTEEPTTQGLLPFPPIFPPILPPIPGETIRRAPVDAEPEPVSPAPPAGEAAVFAWLEESPLVEARVEVQRTEDRGEPEQLHIDEENNADPIDGMLLLPGEMTVRCDCGLVYRVESVRWLEEQLGGDCVQCHAPVRAPTRGS
jgi:hypothetical protein